ncbi:uncharacterized protein G2W53_016388 [Senna tora]|uniref:Uncharacterized protein n=1 Tax=Senna tora TaxID=362788 RepID=A0A834TVY4_9FABA|nr:uncharacterized protein G2W53_016388 [Senna tora]
MVGRSKASSFKSIANRVWKRIQVGWRICCQRAVFTLCKAAEMSYDDERQSDNESVGQQWALPSMAEFHEWWSMKKGQYCISILPSIRINSKNVVVHAKNTVSMSLDNDWPLQFVRQFGGDKMYSFSVEFCKA